MNHIIFGSSSSNREKRKNIDKNMTLLFELIPEDLFLKHCVPHLHHLAIDRLACTCRAARDQSPTWKRAYLAVNKIELPRKAQVQRSWRSFFYSEITHDMVEERAMWFLKQLTSYVTEEIAMHMRAFQAEDPGMMLQLNSPDYSPYEWACKRGTFLYQALQESGLMTSRAGRSSMEQLMISSLAKIYVSTQKIEEVQEGNCWLFKPEERNKGVEQDLLQSRVRNTICRILSDPPNEDHHDEDLTDVRLFEGVATFGQSQKIVKDCFPLLLLSALDQMSPLVLDTFVVDAETGVVTGI